MTTLAPGTWLNRRSKSLSVETTDEVASGGVVQNLTIANAGTPVSKRTFRIREKVAQQWNQFRRQAFIEEKLQRPGALFPAANSAA